MRPATAESYPLGELNKLFSNVGRMQFESTLLVINHCIHHPAYALHLNVCIKMDSTIKAVL